MNPYVLNGASEMFLNSAKHLFAIYMLFAIMLYDVNSILNANDSINLSNLLDYKLSTNMVTIGSVFLCTQV